MGRDSVKGLVLLVCTLTMPVSANLVGYWPLDEGQGTAVGDISGNGHNGTIEGTPDWVEGYTGFRKALQFGPATLGVDCGRWNPSAASGTDSGKVTIACWVKRASGGGAYQGVVANRTTYGSDDTTINWQLEWNRDANFLQFGSRTGAAYALGNLPADQWTHLTVTFDGATVTTYFNGVQQAQGTAARFGLDKNSTVRIGSSEAAGNTFTGTLDDVRLYDTILAAGDIKQVMTPPVYQTSATPRPADMAQDVQREVVLGWSPSASAVSHDVYFGTVAADIAAASRENPGTVLVSRGQDANTYEPPARLDFNTTYYWRVDDVGAAPDAKIFTGAVWSFTTEPVSYPLPGVTATASSFTTGMGPEKMVDGSGLTGDTHSTMSSDMWLSGKAGAETWVQFAFDKAYKLDKVLVWNSNQPTEAMVGFGVKEIVVAYSSDATTWVSLGPVEIAQAPGDPACTPSTVALGGVAAKYVKFTINSNWGGLLPKYGLSEVRFYYVPTWAREPQPAAAAVGVTPPVTLSWRAGREAGSHKVSLGTDPNALTLAGTATTPIFAPANLSLGTKYYWKVEEVNTAQTPSTWAGEVWTFTTSDYLTVDDMESYNDTTRQMFDVWVDGFGTTTNGALVGYTQSANGTFGETAIVHGGKQSMPLQYGQNSATTSEATRTFDVAQDWTFAGVKTLVLYFRGDATNGAGQLYLKVNGTKVDFSGSAASLTAALWKQWNVDLASVSGVNLKAVKSLTIGVSGSGKGILYVDDIRLYQTAPVPVVPVDPGTTGLVSSFTMEGKKVADSVSGITGAVSNVGFGPSMTGLGEAAVFNGTTAWVDLGTDYWTKVVSKLSNCTFSVWVDYSATAGVWQRVFDLGCGTNVNVFLTTSAGTAGIARFAVKTDVPNSGSTGTGFVETGVNAAKAMTVGWHHLVGVVDATGGANGSPVLYLYVDGTRAGGPSAGRLPKDMAVQAGTPWQMWLGRSQYTADPYFNGAMDDLRVYNRALSEGEVRYLAGDR